VINNVPHVKIQTPARVVMRNIPWHTAAIAINLALQKPSKQAVQSAKVINFLLESLN